MVGKATACVTAALICAVTVLVLSGTASAASGPSWSVSEVSYPTNFPAGVIGAANEQGPAYHVVAVNTGDDATSGPFEITVTLPGGVTVSPGQTVRAVYGRNQALRKLKCAVTGQTVTCQGPCDESEVNEGELICPEGPGVSAGESALLNIPVKVAAAAIGPLESSVVVSGGGAAAAEESISTQVAAEPSQFAFLPGVGGLWGLAGAASRQAAVTAGGHPYQLEVHLGFPQNPAGSGPALSTIAAGGGVRDASVSLPPGLVVNPQATPRCREVELEAETCPGKTQVGTIRVNLGLTGNSSPTTPLFNVVPPPGTPAEFGATIIEGVTIHLTGELQGDAGYRLAAGSTDILAKLGIYAVDTTLWGDPTAESHDSVRAPCVNSIDAGWPNCPVERSNVPLITMPSACSGPLSLLARADSWTGPGNFVEREAVLTPGVGDCVSLDFSPNITLRPERKSDSPTGLAVQLHVPQREEYEEGGVGSGRPGRSTSTLREARVVLPPGLVINAAAVNGRTACTASQMGLLTPVGQADATFDNAPAACPDAAKVGSVSVDTPLLDHELPGGIYLASPFENPFGSLLAIYIAIHDPETGVVVKLAGHVEADKATGQLTTTFSENPQLPFSDFHLTFFGGSRAALRTPATCGSYESQSTLAPWSGGGAVSSTDAFSIDNTPSGGPCVGSVSDLPNSPHFTAGTSNPLAGAYSSFVLRLTRQDGSQEFGALNVTLPKGLTGKLANTPYCPDDALAAAAAKSGREEERSPACPAASEIGKVTVGVGAGSLPYFTQGRAYLAGPYKGAPLSLAIVTPAVAGPYDLGDVVVRSKLEVDPYSAQITVRSDPLPRILDGIPLDVRSIVVEVGKSEFTLNPTSCEASAVGAEAVSVTGQAAHVSSRFQAAGCERLAFKPKFSISLKGGTKRTAHPALKAVVTFPKQGEYANISRAQVALPHSEFLDQGNIGKACTKPVLEAHACPAKSIYGKAKAWTPLLAKPLEGPVYLVGGYGYKLPALVAELNGQIRVLLVGKVDTGKRKGIRNTFEAVPDAPVSRFVLKMKGGKKYGLLENSENICRKAQKAGVALRAQNGRVKHFSVKISNSCKRSRKHRHLRKHGHRRHAKSTHSRGRQQ